jgi:voltage-gated potassium channel
LLAFGVLVTLTAAGTAGYMLVEHAQWFDALYMTVLTLSTVGFSETISLSRAGRFFTMCLIFGGVGTVAYFVAILAKLLAVDVLAKLVPGSNMQKIIDRLSNHVIVCGYGRFGQIVVQELTRASIPLLVIERDATRHAELEHAGLLFVLGDATSDDVLSTAGLERARAIVAGTGSDPDNVFITLLARDRRCDIQIHARGETSESIRRLKHAGADRVMSPLQMGGTSIAASIARPSVAQFLELARPGGGNAVDLEEVRVMQDAPLVGKTLASIEADHARLRIVAIVRGERTDLIPAPALRVEVGDHLVVIGERQSLDHVATFAANPAIAP